MMSSCGTLNAEGINKMNSGRLQNGNQSRKMCIRDSLNGPESQKYRIMALVSTPVDAARVCKGVNGIERLTVGGVRKKADYITDNLNLTKEDVEALLSVVEAGIPVGMLPTPRDNFVNLEKLLIKASENREG